MKYILIIASLLLSIQAFAKTPATDALNQILPAGEYSGLSTSGKACKVSVSTQADSAGVFLQSENSQFSFVLINSLPNYSFDEQKSELAASASLRFPKYGNGGTTHLLVRKSLKVENVVEVFISQILFDHHGNDASSYLECAVEL